MFDHFRIGTSFNFKPPTSRQKPFSKVNKSNDNKILKLRYEIKINLIKEDLSWTRKNKAKKDGQRVIYTDPRQRGILWTRVH